MADNIRMAAVYLSGMFHAYEGINIKKIDTYPPTHQKFKGSNHLKDSATRPSPWW